MPDIDAAAQAGLGGTVHERVREWMRSAISSGAYSPGDRLVQNDIAKRLKVSVTPVREAMRDLAAEGVLRFDPRRGATVRKLDAEELAEVRVMHAALVPVWAQLIVERVADEDVARAEALQDRMELPPDIATYIQLNREFHTYLYGLARSPRLFSVITSLQDSTDVVLGMTFSADSARFLNGLEEHRVMIQAIRSRDAALLARTTINHTGLTLDGLSISADAGIGAALADQAPAQGRAL